MNDNQSPTNSEQQVAVGLMVRRLMLAVIFMFGFGFALVPLYDVFCEITGLNGKTSNEAAVYSDDIDTSRKITVEFVTRTQGQLPWDFRPQVKRMVVHPGEMHQVDFLVANHSANNMVVQAIPSVSPGVAASYFNKIECFCFNQQPLKQGEQASLGLQFYIDKDLPADYGTVTLSYTLFDITDSLQKEQYSQLFTDN